MRRKEEQNRSGVCIVTDQNGDKLVVISKIIFKGKRNISWKQIEYYLSQYEQRMIEIPETGDIVCIGKEFADEFTGSIYTRNLRGGLARAKANMSQAVPEMIEIACHRRWNRDFDQKHGKRAERGWYRFDTRFALPILGETGETMRYNVYRAVVIIRCAANGRLYLYDIQNIKKETGNPSWT